MRRLTIIEAGLLVMAVAGLAGWLPLAGQTSASADVSRSRAVAAEAEFVLTDEWVCVDISVSAGRWADQTPPGKPTEGSRLMVVIDFWSRPWAGIVETLSDPDTGGERADPRDVSAGGEGDCPEGFEFDGSSQGWTDAASVEISQGHAWASGVVTVCGVAFPEVCADLAVSLDWDAAGGVSVSGGRSDDPVCNSRDHTASREATATGTMRLLGEEFEPNLIPDPAVYASVGVWQDGAVCRA